jgi:hypothetical protein
MFFANTSLLPISMCLTTKFLYYIGFKGCQRAEIGKIVKDLSQAQKGNSYNLNPREF